MAKSPKTSTTASSAKASDEMSDAEFLERTKKQREPLPPGGFDYAQAMIDAINKYGDEDPPGRK